MRPTKAAGPHGAGGQPVIWTLHEGRQADGTAVPLTTLCARVSVFRGERCIPADQGCATRRSSSLIDCHTRARPCCHVSRFGKATKAAGALEDALVSRFGTPGTVPKAFAAGFENDLAFARRDTARVRSDRLKQEIISPA